MWQIIRDMNYSSNKCGLRLIDYDNMLYPQYGYKFEKTISANTWEGLQKQAKENIKAKINAHPDVIEHWNSIANGEIPFGYTVEDEK